MKKKKPIVKVVYRKVKEEGKEYKQEIKEEVGKLEEKKKTVGGGFGGFIKKMSINKNIYDKNKILRTGDKIKDLKQRNKLGKELLEHERIKQDIKKSKAQGAVNFAPITMESLYG